MLAVSDDASTAMLLQRELRGQALRIAIAMLGPLAFHALREVRPDLMLMHFSSAPTPALHLMREVKKRFSIPVILLATQASAGDIAHGLDLGADDFIVQPFNYREVGARIRALVHREHQAPSPPLRLGSLEIDFVSAVVRQQGAVVGLTALEWRLIQCLAANAGAIVSWSELTSHVWGHQRADDPQALRLLVSRVRRKLRRNQVSPEYIKTMWGLGYLFDPTPA